MESYKYVDRKNNDKHLSFPLDKKDLQNMKRIRDLDKKYEKCFEWSITIKNKTYRVQPHGAKG